VATVSASGLPPIAGRRSTDPPQRSCAFPLMREHAAAADRHLHGEDLSSRRVGRATDDLPGGGLPFWEPGGAALAGRCVFDLVDLAGRPDLVVELRRLREVLGTAAPGEEEVRARHHFHELLNESGEE
jgi:hypothetical protein